MKKRTIALILVLATILTLFIFAACERNGGETGSGDNLPSGNIPNSGDITGDPSGSNQGGSSGNNNDPSGDEEVAYSKIFVTGDNGTKITSVTKYGKTLSKLVIPDTITSIAEGAFYGCSSLTSIVIPSNVMSIGYGAFNGCPIEEATIPTIAINYIPKTNLKKVVITSGTIIGRGAFYNCRTLTSIEILSSVTSIGEGFSAFYNCPIEEATIPTSAIGYIPKSNLKKVVITSGDSIGEEAFRGCSSLTNIEIPSSVTSIGSSAFSGCSKLQYNEYDNAKYLGNRDNPYLVLVRAKNKDITSCTINANTRFIHSSAFYECSSLTSIEIPSSITSIGKWAFYDCKSLEEIYYEGDLAGWHKISFHTDYGNPATYGRLHINGQIV